MEIKSSCFTLSILQSCRLISKSLLAHNALLNGPILRNRFRLSLILLVIEAWKTAMSLLNLNLFSDLDSSVSSSVELISENKIFLHKIIDLLANLLIKDM